MLQYLFVTWLEMTKTKIINENFFGNSNSSFPREVQLLEFESRLVLHIRNTLLSA
jgi:hypothetical protein